ncbi:MAG: hypothetical protein AB1942_03670 [Pseudomonadota bacterium]
MMWRQAWILLPVLAIAALLGGCGPREGAIAEFRQAQLVAKAPAAVCVNPATPNCNFYTSCMEATCKCGYSSTGGYALSYGKKYCDKFLAEAGFSAAGRKWRDATLRCLQEKMVAQLPTNPAQCDCPKLQQAAYDTHVGCYTQPGASICDLPAADAVVIDKVVADSDKFDRQGLEALKAVAKKCYASNPTNQWKQAQAVVQRRIDELWP